MRELTKMECESTNGGLLIRTVIPQDGSEVFPVGAGTTEGGYQGGHQGGHGNAVNIGAAAGALIGGFMAGGPIGFGFALGGLIIATGVNGLIHTFRH